MNVRLDLNQHLTTLHADELLNLAKASAVGFCDHCQSTTPLLHYTQHEVTAQAYYFILVSCRAGGKDKLTGRAMKKARSLLNRWRRPIEDTSRPVISFPASSNPERWLELDPAHRREYLNDRLSLPEFWCWVDEMVRRDEVVFRIADYLGRKWNTEDDAKAWAQVENLLAEVPSE